MTDHAQAQAMQKLKGVVDRALSHMRKAEAALEEARKIIGEVSPDGVVTELNQWQDVLAEAVMEAQFAVADESENLSRAMAEVEAKVLKH